MTIGMFDEFKRLFKKLCLNYNKELDKELCESWYEELEEIDIKIIEMAFRNIRRNENYFPRLSRVFEEIKRIPIKEITDEEKIQKMNRLGINPEWLDKEISNQSIDKETEELFEDFKTFLKDFRRSQ